MSDGAVVALDKGILLRLSGLCVAPSNSLRFGPFHKFATDILRSIVHSMANGLPVTRNWSHIPKFLAEQVLVLLVEIAL
jgi:hypothetical protein